MIIKNRWGMDSRYVGVVIDQVGWHEDDTWKVLWSIKDSYKIQDHLGSNLIEVSDTTIEHVAH